MVSCYILACVDRLAGWQGLAWDEAQNWGKGKKRGTAKKENGERSESRGGQLASLTVLFAFPPPPLFFREKPWARS